MTNQSSFTFKIDRNKRHQIQVEEIVINEKGKVTSEVLFSREYEQANRIVESIVSMQPKSKDIAGLYGEHVENSCVKDNKSGRNNILLFTGPRGGGKTSAVSSFGRFLESNKIGGFRFKCLPMIDPSYFDNNNNILKLVLTTMFKMAKCKISLYSKGGDTLQFSELWKHFNNAFKILGDMEQDRVRDYTLETLNDLGDATNLRETMQRLVDEFISRVFLEKYDFLVLMIDDLDMNVTYAAQMLEQIRKFLMLDKLIILVAANLDQLQNEMREFYSKSFQQTLKDTNQTLSVDVEDLATRYLLKVFPASRRIHLTNVTHRLIETELQIMDIGLSGDVFQRLYGEYQNRKLQQVVLTMIWERTRLLFVPKNASLLHPIIPSNLRDLSQFLNFLLDMKKVECDAKNGKLFKDMDSYILCQQNFTQFKNYFLNNWIPENLSYEEEILFENTPQDVSEINKHFINAINVIGTKNKKRLMSREVDLEQIIKYADGVNIDRDIYTMVSPNDPRFVKANKISDIFNQPSNYSYGDLLLMIDKYETYFESEEARRFINAVKIYYSIILLETMFFKSVDVKYNQSDWKHVKVDTIIPIQKLLGGTVYYPNYFEIITSRFFKQKGPSFDAKRAFYHKFTFTNQIHEILYNFRKKSKERKNEFKKLIDENIHLIFFILYYGAVRPDRYDQKHIYDTTHADDAEVGWDKYATFDILALFNNALNPLQTLRRVHPDFSISVVFKLSNYNLDNIFKQLSNWGDLCLMSDEKKQLSFSNAVLPFYTVDMMLIYLRKTYNDIDIISSTKATESNPSTYREKVMLLFVQAIEECILNKSIFKDDTMLQLIKKYNIETPDKVKHQLIESVCSLKNLNNLIINTFDADSKNLNYSTFAHYFKDKAVSTVYEHSYLTEKEKNEIIKKLHTYQTVPEIFNYMCEVLVKDMVMELIVKSWVQERVRRKTSIHNYYDNLWALTQQAIRRIGPDKEVVCSDIENVFNTIYLKGVKIYIEGK